MAPDVSLLAQTLQALRRERGWNMDRVASKAGISRTTLFHLENGVIRRPRASTLYRLAQALDVPVERLFRRDERPSTGSQSGDPQWAESPVVRATASRESADMASREFDRATNPIVGEVAAADPALFAGWTNDEWDELYSQFATGGALREEGVRITAARINHDRETLYRLRILLQTHLADVATGMVNTLYDLVNVNASSPEERRD